MKILSFFLPIALTATALAQTLNIVAHEDDDLLFLSPNLLHEVQSGRRIRTIFVTAGDAGNDASYWTSRQEGSKAAYAQMSNVSNSWTQSDAGVPGFNIPLFTLNNNPNVSLAFLQLPDGNNGGEGFGLGSLQHLWEGSIDSLTSFSGSSYSKHALVDVLRNMANDFGCDNIRTQDFVHGYGEGDHSDHLTTAYFVREAFDNCDVGKPITSYMGYPVESLAVNIDDETLAQKKAAFYTYAGYDRNTCSSDESCRGRSEEAWVQREYVVDEVKQADCRIPKQPNARNKGKAMAGKPLAQS
ncbi:hypothetical protein ATEIFO6365_0001001000 [Aspergillus terreus]|uniref:N-acetylglucosaminylphosphatidylinositol deacetylase n=1 Tax=Aspergillus terreus TaxID=33178 RepID=A0A5M3YNJ3_ASPTE|nr:hypothetical protein ATETN484_0001000900 [Aspergillus terreus]GFF11790.1 hypothetical protein ATEIFO6365_0001001000 [Aspergillus terreus]